MATPADLTRIYTFVGDNGDPAIDINGYNTFGSAFAKVTITGIQNGNDTLRLEKCRIVGSDISNIEAYDCWLLGFTKPTTFLLAMGLSSYAGGIDFTNAVSATYTLTKVSGDLLIQNIHTVGLTVNIQGNGLVLTIASSCTTGVIRVDGDVRVINAGSSTLEDEFHPKSNCHALGNNTRETGL